MNKLIPLLIFLYLCSPSGLGAQEDREVLLSLGFTPDQFFAFYLPTDYHPHDSSVILLAFHPYHSARWNGRTWEKALQPLAEQQQSILICPDGGADHRTDGYVDLIYAKRAIDSVCRWQGIRSPRVITVGFGYGAKAALMFALNYPSLTQGAVLWATPAENLPEIYEAHPQASGQSFYLINGSRDALATRFFPLRQALVRMGGKTGYHILPEQGHNLRQLNEVFGQGIQWTRRQSDSPPTLARFASFEAPRRPSFQLFPNPARPGQSLRIHFPDAPGPILEMRLFNEMGILKEVVYRPQTPYWKAPREPGQYVVSVYTADEVFSYRLWVQ